MDMGIIANLKTYLSKDQTEVYLENNINFSIYVLDAMVYLKKVGMMLSTQIFKIVSIKRILLK